MRLRLLLPLTVLAAGCAGLSYVQPTSGERARVRFTTTTDLITVLRVYEGPDCAGAESEWMRLRNGVLVTSGTTRLGMPLWDFHDNAAKEVYVSSAKELTGMFFFDSGSWKCSVPFTYKFQANRDYEVSFRVPSRGVCSTSIHAFVGSGDSVTRREVATFDTQAPKESGCYKQFSRPRLF